MSRRRKTKAPDAGGTQGAGATAETQRTVSLRGNYNTGDGFNLLSYVRSKSGGEYCPATFDKSEQSAEFFCTCPKCGTDGLIRVTPKSYETLCKGHDKETGNALQFLMYHEERTFQEAQAIMDGSEAYAQEAPEPPQTGEAGADEHEPAQSEGTPTERKKAPKEGNTERETPKDWPEGLPPICKPPASKSELPKKQPALINGLLRRRGKMLLQGPSKAGKSMALIQLAVALASGGSWLGHRCEKCKVLYVNLEIDEADSMDRVFRVREAKHANADVDANLRVWNLRGTGATIDEISEGIAHSGQRFDVVIIDPLYKLFDGDENDNSSVKEVLKEFDAMTRDRDTAVIYSHHHSKGSKAHVAMQDRSSGSGVFARDYDACVDLTQLDDSGIYSADRKEAGISDNATAWVAEFDVRSFASPKPLRLWFDFPLHTTGRGDALQRLSYMNGTAKKSQGRDTSTQIEEALEKALKEREEITKSEAAKLCGKSWDTVRKYVDESKKFERYQIPGKGAFVRRKAEGEN